MSRQSLAENSSGALIGTVPVATVSPSRAMVMVSGPPGFGFGLHRSMVMVVGPARARPRPFHLFGDPPVHVVRPAVARGRFRRTRCTRRADGAEVGPPGVPTVAEQ